MHVMKAYERMQIQLNTLTLVLGGIGELNAVAILPPQNKAPLTHRTGGCKGPKTGVAAFEIITFQVPATYIYIT